MTIESAWQWLIDGGESNRSLPSCNPEPIKDLPELDKNLASKLLVFQRDPVRWHIKNLRTHNLSIDASFCGIGKTYIYCAVAKALNMRPLILSPRSVIIQTKRVMEDHFKMSYIDVINYEGIKSGKTPHLKRSVDARKKSGYKFEWCLPADCLLIFDEGHNCSSPTGSLNSQMLIQAKKQNIPLMVISATLATSPLKMKALGYVLGLHNLSDFTAF
jgi:superfamily II DNA or RNA helicase